MNKYQCICTCAALISFTALMCCIIFYGPELDKGRTESIQMSKILSSSDFTSQQKESLIRDLFKKEDLTAEFVSPK